jgi:hypothetical protein
MPCLVLTLDREVPVSLKFVSARGRSGMLCLVLPRDRQVAVSLRHASTRRRLGDALFSVGMGQAGPCPPQAGFYPWEAR